MAAHEALTYYFQDMHLGDATLYFCGYQDCPPGQFNTPHIRPYYLLVYIRRGRGIFHTAHASYALGAGCTFCIFPGEVINYQADEADPWEYFWIAFDGPMNGHSMDRLLRRAAFSREQPVHRAHRPDALSALYAQAFALCRDADAFTDLKLGSLFLDILHHYIQLPNVYAPPDAAFSRHLNPYVADALHYIRAHYHEDISVSAIAAQVGLTREYFSALFTQALHTPPSTFLREYRLRFAASLLLTTDCTITEIAYRVGFHDYCYFANQFRALFGLTPGQYRRHFRIVNAPDR